jgi:threonine dehydratase
MYKPTIQAIEEAATRVKEVAMHTPLALNFNISEQFKSNVYLKREDLQIVRSYKIRGAYNMISSLTQDELKHGVVCASAGNHAQGFAYSCNKLNINGKVFMPSTTSKQKIKQVKHFGRDKIEVILIGDTFDAAQAAAKIEVEKTGATIIPPFDHPKIIEGQGTIGLEILQDATTPIDYIFVPIGGGGLAAGLSTYIKEKSPNTKIIGVEPLGAPAMKMSIKNGVNTELEKIDGFVDGAAVKKVGDYTFDICKENLDDIILVPEGLVCSAILKLYNEEAIVCEPAGALSIAALHLYKKQIKGKNVVCVVSGSNNDITRTPEIQERSLLYEGLKHYFIVSFPQRAGALKEFLNMLGPHDDIVHFEYVKKSYQESGPALVGIVLQDKNDYNSLVERMNTIGIKYKTVNDNPELFKFLI